jgi:uncharacterized coiled-coil protein SlyX
MKDNEKQLLIELLQQERTRSELCALLVLNDSSMRKEVSELACEYPVISYSTKKGYRICDTKKLIKENNQKEIELEINELRHTLAEINSRIKKLKKRMRPLIASLKVLEREVAKND